MDQTMVEIIIGSSDEEKTFTVHKELLCYHSVYFRNAFEGEWKESEDKSIRIHAAFEEVFRVVCHWLYDQSSRMEPDSPPPKVARSDTPQKDCSCSDCRAPVVVKSKSSILLKSKKAGWFRPPSKTIFLACFLLSARF